MGQLVGRHASSGYPGCREVLAGLARRGAGRGRGQVADVADVARMADGSGTLTVLRSKTDQEGRGHVRYLGAPPPSYGSPPS